MAEPAAATTPKKMTFRTCNMCRTRMSNLDYDPHLICSSCRGSECDQVERCNECVVWSDEKMASYVKHKSSLERKRLSKSKCAKKTDLYVMCTGPGAGALPSGNGAADRGPMHQWFW